MTPNTQAKHRRLNLFWNDESGAVTVDWVVLTAGVVGLVLSVFTVFTPEVFDVAVATISTAFDEAIARP
ncbi:MAG: hypothetical protein ACK4HF_16885 [Paracoccaceae bacterium]